MGVRVRYRRTELSEGIVETIDTAVGVEVMDDLSVKLLNERGKIVTRIHPQRWDCVVEVNEDTVYGTTAIRVRYCPTELSEGVVETIHEAVRADVVDDNTVKLWGRLEGNKIAVIGFVHPDRWDSTTVVRVKVKA